MRNEYIKDILVNIQKGNLEVDDAMEKLKYLHFEDIGYAKIDNHREIRTGYPEVIFCQGKSIAQIKGIVEKMIPSGNNIMGTRADVNVYNELKPNFPDIIYHEQARIIFLKQRDIKMSKKKAMVITAGTSDIPVAEEVAVTAEALGTSIDKIYDVGVAGIHRLFYFQQKLNEASVIIAVAGMEGALASVIGGLVDKPVIAVPTSIGYGANFNGLAPLLSMLNSCASGVGVVNIDNGFGAAYLASLIIRQIENNT